MDITLPEMHVEKRDGKHHGLPTPTDHSKHPEQLRDMLEMVEAAKLGEFPQNLLLKYAPKEVQEGQSSGVTMQAAMRKFGFESWTELVEFVRDDDPAELPMRVYKVLHREGYGDDSRGFIANRVGLWKRWSEFIEPIMQEGFDEKYDKYKRFKTNRPLELLRDKNGFVCRPFFSYMHPGHPTYPAGHDCDFSGSWFFIKVEFPKLNVQLPTWSRGMSSPGDVSKPTPTGSPSDAQKMLLMCRTMFYLGSMARAGAGVHFPEDNTAGYLVAKKHVGGC